MAPPITGCYCGTTDHELLIMILEQEQAIFDRQQQILNALVVLSQGVTFTPFQGSLTDRSGTIAAANVSQVLAPAKANRRYLFIENTSGGVTTGNLWFNFTAAANSNQPSLRLAVNGSFVMEGGFISTEVINVTGETTGMSFTAKEG